MFLGTHMVGVDAKGRVSVPAAFRARLGRRLENADARLTLYVWPSYRGAFLEAGDMALLEAYQAVLEARGEFDDMREDFDYAIFGEARALDLDETGRVTLPADLRAHADLAGQASFVGLSNRFEIWSPTLLAKRVAEARGRAAETRPLLSRTAKERGEAS